MMLTGYGERLQNSIKSAGITQKELSAKMRISEDSIVRYIKEKSYPKINTLIEICDFLNISIIWLLSGKEENSSSLTEYETDMLVYFRKLPEKEQLKCIGRLELQAEEIENLRKAESSSWKTG